MPDAPYAPTALHSPWEKFYAQIKHKGFLHSLLTAISQLVLALLRYRSLFCGPVRPHIDHYLWCTRERLDRAYEFCMHAPFGAGNMSLNDELAGLCIGGGIVGRAGDCVQFKDRLRQPMYNHNEYISFKLICINCKSINLLPFPFSLIFSSTAFPFVVRKYLVISWFVRVYVHLFISLATFLILIHTYEHMILN